MVTGMIKSPRRRGAGDGAFVAFVLAALALPVGMASAQSILDNRPTADSGRYQMQVVEGGIARMDTRTGAIVLCRTGDGRIACDGTERDAGARPPGDTARQAESDPPQVPQAHDDVSQAGQSSRDSANDAALENAQTLQALAGRIAELERKVTEMEADRPSRDADAAADAAIDRAGRMFRGFADIIRDFDEDMRQDRPGGRAGRGDDLGNDAPTYRGDENENEEIPGGT